MIPPNEHITILYIRTIYKNSSSLYKTVPCLVISTTGTKHKTNVLTLYERQHSNRTYELPV
jgi:hypothetical protein